MQANLVVRLEESNGYVDYSERDKLANAGIVDMAQLLYQQGYDVGETDDYLEIEIRQRATPFGEKRGKSARLVVRLWLERDAPDTDYSAIRVYGIRVMTGRLGLLGTLYVRTFHIVDTLWRLAGWERDAALGRGNHSNAFLSLASYLDEGRQGLSDMRKEARRRRKLEAGVSEADD